MGTEPADPPPVQQKATTFGTDVGVDREGALYPRAGPTDPWVQREATPPQNA